MHALAHAINQSLDNQQTVVLTEPVEAHPVEGRKSLGELVDDMRGGQVQALFILGGNPVYTAPADVDFGRELLRLSRRSDGFTLHMGLYADETANLCQWHVPQSHYLETWGDVRAFDGTVSLIQPLIAPLYRSRSEHELLAALQGRYDVNAYDLVRDYWRRHADGDFEAFWHRALSRGIVEGSELPPAGAALLASAASPAVGPVAPAVEPSALEIVFRPDPCVWEGSFSNIGWQQELPKPFTKLTWDNAALMSVGTARRLGLKDRDVVTLSYGGREVRAAVLMLPGTADDAVTVHLGYGRTLAGRLGSGLGFNAYALRTADQPWAGAGLRISPTGQVALLAVTHGHHPIDAEAGAQLEPEVIRAAATPGQAEAAAMYNRKLVRVGTVELFRRQPDFVKRMEGEGGKKPLLSLYPGYRYEGYKWGMSIDLQSCIGCNACVVGCQAENNIPVVGKEQVLNLREMHWIRIDDYYGGDLDNPRVYHQPVPCMHCENAPCEVVCPVGATVHDAEGINNMVYNRCVGTRYCSNNCPYKVRRFNFLLYADYAHPTVKMQKNPSVTVRNRGVMEKCTYCIQRIAAGRIEAEKENRKIHDGEVQTACQQACPTRAIVFGDLNDAGAEVTKLKQTPLDYGILTELTTVPRTTYMPRIFNPNADVGEREV